MIRIQTDPPSSQVVFSIHQWAHLIDDWRPVWAGIREVYNRHQRRHFATEGAATGSPWTDLSPVYKAWKEKKHPGAPILVLTGALREAATGGKGSVNRERKRSLTLGVKGGVVPYARYHQTGKRGPPRLPARPVIRFAGSVLGEKSVFDGPSAPFGAAIRQLVQAHVVRARREAFGHNTAAADATIARILRTDTR